MIVKNKKCPLIELAAVSTDFYRNEIGGPVVELCTRDRFFTSYNCPARNFFCPGRNYFWPAFIH